MALNNDILKKLHIIIQELLQEIDANTYHTSSNLPTIDRVVTLDTFPKFTALETRGYRKSRLWVGYPTDLIFNIPCIGQSTVSIKPGWTELNLPDDIGIACVDNSLRVLYRLSM